MFPDKFEKASTLLEKLPGVGNKTAQRYVFALLKLPPEVREDLGNAILALNSLRRCEKCGFLSDGDICDFCKDNNRDKSQIMVLSYDQDVNAIEKTNGYYGLYHVINGEISSIKGIYPEDLNIQSLINRIDETIKEIIIATSFTMEGEMTAMYLNKILKDKNVKVTRLAHGLPMGANLDYADEWTLLKAMDNRKILENE